MEKTDIIALLGLNAVPGLGPGRLNNLLMEFDKKIDTMMYMIVGMAYKYDFAILTILG